jgi:hypothetical protein
VGWGKPRSCVLPPSPLPTHLVGRGGDPQTSTDACHKVVCRFFEHGGTARRAVGGGLARGGAKDAHDRGGAAAGWPLGVPARRAHQG